MPSPEPSWRRSRRQSDCPDGRVSTLRDPIGHIRTRASTAEDEDGVVNPCDAVFSPFERAQDLLKSDSGGRIAWNAPHTTGHDSLDSVGVGRYTKSGSGRPSSSLGPRTSVKPHSTSEVIPNLSRRTSSTKRSSSQTRASSRGRKPDSRTPAGPVKTKSSGPAPGALHQKSKNRERAFKARQEELARIGRLLEAGCRVPKPVPDGPDFTGPFQEVPSLRSFVELQSGVLERWVSAKTTALAALEAVAEAERAMEYLAEFWTHAENLKKRKWDVGVDGFLALNQTVEKELSDQHKKDDEDTSKESKQDMEARKPRQKHELATGEYIKNTPEYSNGNGRVPSGALHHSHDINTGRSIGSVSSSSSVKSVAGSSRGSGPEDTSICLIKTVDSCDQGSPSAHEDVTVHMCRPPLVRWSIVESDGSVEACKVYVKDLQGMAPRFQAETEVWFLTVIENAFVNKNRKGVYSKEDCCTLLKTLSKVQDWLETEPAKSRAAVNHPQDIRLLVRDTVIFWGSQLFFLPSTEA